MKTGSKMFGGNKADKQAAGQHANTFINEPGKINDLLSSNSSTLTKL